MKEDLKYNFKLVAGCVILMLILGYGMTCLFSYLLQKELFQKKLRSIELLDQEIYHESNYNDSTCKKKPYSF